MTISDSTSNTVETAVRGLVSYWFNGPHQFRISSGSQSGIFISLRVVRMLRRIRAIHHARGGRTPLRLLITPVRAYRIVMFNEIA